MQQWIEIKLNDEIYLRVTLRVAKSMYSQLKEKLKRVKNQGSHSEALSERSESKGDRI